MTTSQESTRGTSQPKDQQELASSTILPPLEQPMGYDTVTWSAAGLQGPHSGIYRRFIATAKKVLKPSYNIPNTLYNQ